MTVAWKSQLENGEAGHGMRKDLIVWQWTFWQRSNNSCPIFSSTMLENFLTSRKDI